MHKKHVQEINKNNNAKSNDERKCSPKINIDHLSSPGQSFFESRVVKGKKVFQCLGTRCSVFATTRSLEVIGTVSLGLSINSGTRCFGFATT